MKKIINAGVVLIFLGLICISGYHYRPHVSHYADWHNGGYDITIAHALGGINNSAYTNSRDAFLRNYENGDRIFEVDFAKTNDDVIVLNHVWEGAVPDSHSFLSERIEGKYEALSIYDLFEILQDYPDIYIITDTKYDIVEYMQDIYDAACDNGYEDVLGRFVIQIYQKGQEKQIRSISSKFDSYIFTLYFMSDYQNTVDDFTNIVWYCCINNIDSVTMWDTYWNTSFCPIKNSTGIKVYTHTVNDVDAAKGLLSTGVDGIYTDYIDVNMLEN